MPRWTAAQILSGFALGKPLEREEWPSDMDGKILPAQLKLREAIAQRRISDVRGRLGPPGSKEQRLTDLFSDSESMGFTLLVTPYGTLTVHPPYKRHKFEEKHKIDLDDWWRGINFDQDEGEQAVSVSLAPCQGQPDRPYLRLVSGARSGEAEAPGFEPAARAEQSTSDPAPSVESEPAPPTESPCIESVPSTPKLSAQKPPPPEEAEQQPRKWQPKDVKAWFRCVKEIDPQKRGENNTAYAHRLGTHMAIDFEIRPWGDETIRRRLNDPNYD